MMYIHVKAFCFEMMTAQGVQYHCENVNHSTSVDRENFATDPTASYWLSNKRFLILYINMLMEVTNVLSVYFGMRYNSMYLCLRMQWHLKCLMLYHDDSSRSTILIM